MAITRYRTTPMGLPWQEFDEMTNRLQRLFGERALGDRFFGEAGDGTTWLPAVNVEETRDEVLLTAELPGMRREDVNIELENNVLTLSGRKEETREEPSDEDRRYHVWERRWGSFQRSFTLPRTVDAEGISATFQEGVLSVRMPKVPEAKGRKIEIKAETA
jgi:HSP20 family protein